MNKNYMIYPLKTMRITQSYHGETSHRLHWYQANNYRDYPIDDGGLDSGRDPIYCPCDEMKVTAIRGLGNASVTNTIWLVSTSPVVAPTFNDIAFMTLTHSNDQDLSKIKVGDIFKRGEIICHEGSDGATSNHIHIVAGKGYCDTWIENNNHNSIGNLIENKDDHAKNFAFLYRDGDWHFAPAYDLLPSEGINGFRTTSINDSIEPTKEDLFAVATQAGLDKKEAEKCFERMQSVVVAWRPNAGL